MIKDITCIILAGGKSSRMGADKAFMPFNEKPLIEILKNKFSRIFNDILIIANDPVAFKKYQIAAIPDMVKDTGPMGGIYTGLLNSKTLYNFVVACDMPFVNEDLVNYMLKMAKGHDVCVVQLNGKFEPLCAVYSKNCISQIKRSLSAGNFRMRDIIKDLKACIITEKEVNVFDPESLSFININTPAEYENVRILA